MARSNPNKRKPRSVKHTTLIVAEGETDEAFLNYLKQLGGRNTGSNIKIKCARGGGGDGVIKYTINNCQGFDRVIAFYDNDRPPTLKGNLRKAKKLKVEHFTTEPCVEGLYLEILGKTKPQFPNHYNLSDQCKQEIEKLNQGDLLDSQTYYSFTPIKTLQAIRGSIPVLDNLMKVFKL